ncbi:MAG: ParA family protein [Planctomycetota bacterium]|nr:ParA family protein [Planctomycetota bacterium]MDA0931921.1 ParA family protein [Planctomycetota bacterium]MDA1220442.1 ParA family protein [Planctomycetota bacterium]
MKIVAVINQKGGVGKTTTTVNVGAALARLGRKVLLLDLDPQSNLTLHVDQRPELESATLTQLLVEDRPLRDLVLATRTEGLFVVPTDSTLGGVEQVLANRIGRETILREAFDAYDGDVKFDYVLVDCPPSLGVLSANALVAANEVLIPMQTEYFSLQGMAKLTEVIDLVKRRLNPSLDVLCVLPCMVDLRTRLTTEVLENISAYFGDRLARNLIRNNVKLAEAPSFGLTIFEHAPDSNGAEDYWEFAREFLERHGETISDAELYAAAGYEVEAEAETEVGAGQEAAPDPNPPVATAEEGQPSPDGTA